MMILSGVGDSVAGYVAYSLRGLSDAYAAMDEGALSELRLKQAEAMEQSFDVEPGSVPSEFRQLYYQKVLFYYLHLSKIFHL